MAQDLMRSGVPDGGLAQAQEQDPISPAAQEPEPPNGRKTLALLVALGLFALVIGTVVLIAAPWASAAGSCGGG
jgi:hypothetical protein